MWFLRSVVFGSQMCKNILIFFIYTEIYIHYLQVRQSEEEVLNVSYLILVARRHTTDSQAGSHDYPIKYTDLCQYLLVHFTAIL